MKPENAWKDSDLRIAACVFVVLLGYLGTVHLKALQPDCDVSTDAPYHITMADLFGELALGKHFPPMAKSVWKHTFYDKELAFHAFLNSLRKWAGLLGYRGNAPPFILETFVLVSSCLAIFWALLWRSGVRQTYVFLPLFLLGFPLFTLRLNMVRPHVVSIMLMMVTVGLLIGKAPICRRRLLQLALVGFAFSYCHSNPHFMLFPTLVFAAVYFSAYRWRSLLPAGAALAGIIAGLALHPQFPNTFIIWKIQCIDVLWQSLTHSVPDITSPSELERPMRFHVIHNLLLPALPLVISAAAMHRRRFRTLNRRICFVFALTAISCVGYFLSKRTIEYAVPFALLLSALVYQKWFSRAPRSVHLAVLTAISVFVLCMRPLHVCYFSDSRVPIPLQFAHWARTTLPPGTYIANLRWDDFPRLFFAAPEYVYSYGLDPMFAYKFDPDSFLKTERMYRGTEPFPPPDELKELLGSRYVFTSFVHYTVSRRMARAGYALAYQGIDGWCFDLDAPTIDHRIDERLDPIKTY